MKVLIAICLVAALAHATHAGVTEEQKAKMKELYKKCVDKTGVDKELILKARNGEFVDDDKLKAYMQCMFLALGFMDEDGTLHADVMKSKLPESVDKEKGNTVIEKCISEKDSDLSATAYNLFKCFRKAIGQEIRLF